MNNEYKSSLKKEEVLEIEYVDQSLDRSSPTINKKVADTPYPLFTLMPAQGRRICYYNQDGDLVA